MTSLTHPRSPDTNITGNRSLVPIYIVFIELTTQEPLKEVTGLLGSCGMLYTGNFSAPYSLHTKQV